MEKFAKSIIKKVLQEILERAQTLKSEQLFALADKLGAGDADTSGIDDQAASILRFLGKHLGLTLKLLELLEGMLGGEKQDGKP
jgi:hypothetical protein